MNKHFPDHNGPMDDTGLQYFLGCHDPVVPPTHTFLAALEADIFAQIDALAQDHSREVLAANHIPAWMSHRSWTTRAVVFTAVLIVASGFIVGQTFYGETDASALMGAPSLLAFANEPILQSIPPTDASWGDKDEDAQ